MATNDKDRREHTTEELKSQLDAVREEVRTLGRMTRSAASDELEAIQERGKRTAADAKERIENVEEEFLEQIRRRPLRSIVIAAGVGAFLGIVLRR